MPDQGSSTVPVRDEDRAPEGARDLVTEAADTPTATPTSRPPSLWRNRDYMFWWSGNAVSLLGSNVSNFAFPLLAIFTTGSVLNAGIIAAAGRIGGLLTLLTGPVRINLLAIMALLSGLINGVRAGAVLPALRRIVPREQFAARAAQEQGQAMAAQLAGSPLAALLFTVAPWLPFVLDAVSFFFASIGAVFIRHPLGPDREPPAGAESAAGKPKRPSVISDIRDGFRVIIRNDFLRYTTGWVAVTNLVGNSFMLLVVALLYSRGASPGLIGVTNSGVLAGGILGALLAGAILRRMRALRVFQLGGWIYVVSLGLAAILPAPWQIGLATAAFTFASVPTVTVWESYTARLVPDHLAGRVGAASAFCAQSLTWLGMLLAGWLANVWGATVATLCFAAILVPFAIAGHLAKSLTILRAPLDQVEEVSLEAATG